MQENQTDQITVIKRESIKQEMNYNNKSPYR